MSAASDDPYAIEEDLTNHPDEESPRMSRMQFFWGILLLMLALVGDLGAASLDLGNGELACVFIGLWLAQYVIVWLLVQSYVASKLNRILLGIALTLGISLLAVVGMGVAWPPGIPLEIVAMIFAGSLGIYALAGWIQRWLFAKSDFHWISKSRVGSSQFSIRMMLGAMGVSAFLAMVIKWLRFTPYGSGRFGLRTDFLIIGIWFEWIAIGIGLLTFLTVAVFRSKSRHFYIPVFLLTALAGPALVQTVGLWIIGLGLSIRSSPKLEYYLWAYSIEAGLILGILMAIPLLPSVSKMRSYYES